MIDTLVACRFYLDDLEDPLTLTALRMLVKDLLILFQAGNEGVINLLEHYFEMSHIDGVEVCIFYPLYTHFSCFIYPPVFLPQFEKCNTLTDFFRAGSRDLSPLLRPDGARGGVPRRRAEASELTKRAGAESEACECSASACTHLPPVFVSSFYLRFLICSNEPLLIPPPSLQAPVSLAGALQEYLDDPMFEQNRIEYKTNKEAAKRAGKGGKGAAASATPPVPPLPSSANANASA